MTSLQYLESLIEGQKTTSIPVQTSELVMLKMLMEAEDALVANQKPMNLTDNEICHSPVDDKQAIAPVARQMPEAEIADLFRKNCVDYPGNYEVTPGQAIRIVRTIESRAAAPVAQPSRAVMIERLKDAI